MTLPYTTVLAEQVLYALDRYLKKIKAVDPAYNNNNYVTTPPMYHSMPTGDTANWLT